MRLILMGTGPFAVPTFRALYESPHDVLAVVTRPVPPARGRRSGPANPVLEEFQSHSVSVLAPPDVNAPEFCQQLADLRPDLLIVCDYGQILSNEALAVAALGGVNLHGSLLPKYRGAAPVNWAIWNGDMETGVTIIHMTPRLDAGPCLTQASTSIGPQETAVELEPRLAQLGVSPVFEAIQLLESWDGNSPLGLVQDRAQATKAPRLKKMDGNVDWSQSAERICNQVRALKPWPGTFTMWQRKTGPMRLILDKVSDHKPNDGLSAAFSDAPWGEVVQVDRDQIQVATGSGILAIDRIKPAGKRVLAVGEFLRGYPIQVGDRLGE